MKHKLMRWIVLITIIAIFYVSYLERHLLSVEHVMFQSSAITEELDGLTIVQFSDTQLGVFYTINDLERAVNKINELKADIVVFTGDLIDDTKVYEGSLEDIIAALDRIQSTYGKYSVYGIHDLSRGGHIIYPYIMSQSGFKLLKNDSHKIQIGDSLIQIAGSDDWLVGHPAVSDTLVQLEKEAFTIMLIHEPDVADLTAHYAVDLQLSGHSHGGQVSLPFMEPFFTPYGAKKYTEGMYKINERLHLYVNTGLGNTLIPFRLSNIPEITLITCQSVQ